MMSTLFRRAGALARTTTAAAALATGVAAQAADLDQDVLLDGSPSTGWTAASTAFHGESGSFLDTFRFTVASASLVDVSLVTIGNGNAQQISFTEAWLNGVALDISTSIGSNGVRTSHASLFEVPLSGDLVLTVKGYAGGALTAGTSISASYSGTFNVLPVASAVPEPTAYAMFLGGLGLMALMLRRRRQRH